MKHLGKYLMVFIVLASLVSCSQSSAIEVGQAAPDFTLKDMDGQSASLSDFKGKAMILNFFASWCPPCRSEIPDFVELQKAYGDKGFTFIGVSLVSAGESKDFAAKMGINYPILIDDGKVSASYGPVRSIPTTFVIDKNMKVVKMYIGSRSKGTFEADIKGLLK
ncbi:MAG: TlpA disulfide reductase family protein [Candidatus Omnitrophica bacterium]|nr:TlpA disulfide reductase family protein [Candidatus Omnitrophota bacterium]MDD5437340.1 TlpA disulfide reductase family protein [Candidatus Omnitrophota bacterium]